MRVNIADLNGETVAVRIRSERHAERLEAMTRPNVNTLEIAILTTAVLYFTVRILLS